jgi:hypothetical protein
LNELAVLDLPFAGSEAADWHVVRRIDKAHTSRDTGTEVLHKGLIACIPAANAMATAGPHIPGARYRSTSPRTMILFHLLHHIKLWNIDLEQLVDLHGVKGGEFEVKAQSDELLKLDAQTIVIPPGVFRNAIKRKPESLEFRGCAVAHNHRSDFPTTKFAHDLPYGVPINHKPFLINYDRHHLSEMPYQLAELVQLLSAVPTRMAGV